MAARIILLSLLAAASAFAQAAERPRARAAGIVIGVLEPGPLNAITDVRDVRVGHVTLVEGDSVRTGVTAIVPHGGNVFRAKVPAAIAVGNGFGKLVGSTQVDELGRLETPIVLTNTLSTFVAADALVDWTLRGDGNEDVRSVNPVVGECNDGFLNDIRARVVTADHVRAAIDGAKTGPVAEGCVGAGTGTRCLGFKGGVGTASRKLGYFTVGVLVQTNFGGSLAVAGVPIGRLLGKAYLQPKARPVPDRGSCIVVVATDAPLDARRLGRLARRALLGLAAVGSPMTHGSGDYVIAFSTHDRVRLADRDSAEVERPIALRDDRLSPLFQAARDATEEAVLNSLFAATTTTGFRGRTVDALPIDRVVELVRKR